MKTILRNFISVVRRFKMATLLNIMGLTVAFAAFIIIMMQVNYERGYDRFHPNADRIFRVEFVSEGNPQAIICRPLIDDIIASSPRIKAGALVNPWEREAFFSVEKNGVTNHYKEKMVAVYPHFVTMFDFKLTEGVTNALASPDKVLLPESIAQKVFGNEPALGKMIITEGSNLTVEGVYKDFPKNSVIKNVIYRSFPKEENAGQWQNWNYNFYILLDSPESSKEVIANFQKGFNYQSAGLTKEQWDKGQFKIRFTPLTDIYYTNDVAYDSNTDHGTHQTTNLLFGIALIIVLIAAINFTNFSTALTPIRIKSINTQKVLGGSDRMLRCALLVEAILISLLSFGLSLVLIYYLSGTSIASLVSADMQLSSHGSLILISGGLSLITGLLAGIYPAFYITSFPPALVLKGSFGLSYGGRKLRNVLISIQFIASLVLIIASLFMYLQNQYMQKSPLGFDKEQLVVVQINSAIYKSKDVYEDKLKMFSGIEDVTFSEALLSGSDEYMGWGRKYHDKDIQFTCIPVHPDFLRVMGINVNEGRDFRNEDALTKGGAYIFNQKAKDDYDLKIGETIDGGEIAGIISNVKFASFRMAVAPMAFYVWGSENWGTKALCSYIRIKAGTDIRPAVQHIRNTLASLDDTYPFEIKFYDDVLNKLYKKEQSLSSLITFFSLLAVFISIVGVFGLVVFESQYKKKEIGIRKVHGSTTAEILFMFNKIYIRILLICFVIASPVAYYGVSRWLENFAYKSPIYWWVFFLALVIIMVITMATVTFQNWKAANENPVNSLKSE